MPGPTPRRPTPETAANSGKTAPGKPFKKGQSGNPSGRPKVAAEFKERCRAFTDEHVFEFWRQSVIDRDGNAQRSSEMLAAYSYGKPSQAVEHTGKDGEPISIVINLGGKK